MPSTMCRMRKILPTNCDGYLTKRRYAKSSLLPLLTNADSSVRKRLSNHY